MFYKARPQLDHTPEEAAKKLRGPDAKRWAELKTELAKFKDIKPPDAPIAQAMIDNGKDAPSTHVLAVGVYDAYKEEVQPGFLSILDSTDARITPRGEDLRETDLTHAIMPRLLYDRRTRWPAAFASVAVIDCIPAVWKVTENVCVP